MKLKASNRSRILTAVACAYESDDIEIYPDAEITLSADRGAWIEARVYVRLSDLPEVFALVQS